MNLHLLTRSPYQTTAFTHCVDTLKNSNGSAYLILVAEAIYAIRDHTDALAQLLNLSETIKIYYLLPDAIIRGIELTQHEHKLLAISDEEFLDLSIHCKKLITW